jgi:hypothetical protein
MVEHLRRSLDPHGLLKVRPNRSLELLFQAMLRRLVTPAPPGFPEMEIKFDLLGGMDGSAHTSLIAGLDGAALLLPAPHHIHRMRRYHICSDALSGDECTVVETPSGRLSEKRKRAPRMAGAVMLRDTTASRTTDLDGVAISIERFLSERSWVRLASFEKRQTKIPFSMPGGRAYLLSLDHCVSTDGVALDQLEIEYIGTIGSASPDVGDVARELEMLCGQLLSGELGHRFALGGSSKHAFFAQSALSLEPRRISIA